MDGCMTPTSLDNLEIFPVVPVGEENRPNVNIVLRVRWTMNEHRPKQTCRVLSGVVRMPP